MRNQPTKEQVAQRIRSLRKARGWTLADVESKSHGSITAVALGSYERCDRALSLERLIELARFFDVPLTHLITEPAKRPLTPMQSQLIIDLRRLKSCSTGLTHRNDANLIALCTLVAAVANRRSDWNSEVLSLRQSDLVTLSLMTTDFEDELLLWLKAKRLIFTGRDLP